MNDRVIVLTGAGNGIGAAMARRFAAEQPMGIVVSDIDREAAVAVCEDIEQAGVPAVPLAADATRKPDHRHLVRTALRRFGRLDLFCSNAGAAFGTGVHAADTQWERSWQLNVMQHVYAAQSALPSMLRNDGGHLLITASAAGLLGAPGDAPYSVSKHAAVGLAEWLAATYRPRGIGVSALCPLGVRTELLMPGIEAGHPSATAIAAAAPLLEPEEVAESVVAGLAAGQFLILPHARVRDDYAAKAQDPDRWLDRTATVGAPGGA